MHAPCLSPYSILHVHAGRCCGAFVALTQVVCERLWVTGLLSLGIRVQVCC